jgi:hypothetical protein
LPGTNVLETTYRTPSSPVRVTDTLTLRSRAPVVTVIGHVAYGAIVGGFMSLG